MSPPAIPQTDPRAGYLAHRAEIDSAITGVLEGGRYILGSEVSEFEREFARYIGVTGAVGVGSGTDALELALLGCDVGKGDLVFTVSHTAVATVAAIEASGATPVFVDVDPASFAMDATLLEAAISNASGGRPRAVVPVHLYGHPADMIAIMEVAGSHGLDVIEDCAQSHGASINGRMTGSWGRAAAFSFYPTKNLGTAGDGGMVATGDTGVAEKVRLLQQYGWKERYISQIPGRNSRLDELHAAILRVKLRYLDEDNRRRNQIARTYDSFLADAGLELPATASGVTHVYHQYAVRAEHRDDLRSSLREDGIGSLVHYPVPVHEQPAYASRLASHRDLRHTERIARHVLSLPMFPQLSDDHVSRVAECVLKFQRGKAQRS